MTERDRHGPDDDADTLAAEYVLGVLDLADRLAAEARIKADPAFAALVAAWEQRLSPLNAEYAPVPGPDLLPAIEARLFPAPPATRRRGLSWRLLAGALTAAVIALAVVVSFGPPPTTGPVLTAELRADAQPLVFDARYDQGAGTLTLTRRAGAGAGAGRDYELWSIRPNSIPASLGVVRGDQAIVSAPALGPGILLAVSLEPEGGSPTGQATGPVLVSGALSGPITNP